MVFSSFWIELWFNRFCIISIYLFTLIVDVGDVIIADFSRLRQLDTCMHRLRFFQILFFFDFFNKLCNCLTRFVGLALILKRYSISLQLVSSFKIANWNGSFYHFAPLFEFFMPIINGVMTNTRQLQQKTVTITIYISITQCIIFTWRYAIYYGLQMPNTKKEEKKTDLQQCSDKTNMKTEFTCKYTFCTYV